MTKRVSEDKFIKYLPEFFYFGLSVSRQGYILLTAADLTKCTTGRITACPSKTALYDVKSYLRSRVIFPEYWKLQSVKETSSSTTTRRPFCNDTGQHGYTIFQRSGKSPSAVRMVTAGKSTRNSLRSRYHTQCYRVLHHVQRASNTA